MTTSTGSQMRMIADLPQLATVLDGCIGTHCVGAQAFVRQGGRTVVDDGVGASLTGPMTAGSLHQVWCATKPVAAMAIGFLEDEGLIELNQPIPLRNVPDLPLEGKGMTPASLLNHTSGLVHPGMFEVRLLPAARRLDAIRAAGTNPGEPGVLVYPTVAYSSFLAGYAIDSIVQTMTDRTTSDYLTQHSLEPLGLTDIHFGLKDVAYDSNLARIGTYFTDLPERATPLLHDRVRSFAADASAAYGAYVTMHDLGTWFAAVQQQIRSSQPTAGLPSVATLTKMFAARRDERFDRALGRDCDFAAGFMLDLTNHGFGREPTEDSFGIVGYLGSSFAFADPAEDLVAAVLINGMVGNDVAHQFREAATTAIYRDLR